MLYSIRKGTGHELHALCNEESEYGKHPTELFISEIVVLIRCNYEGLQGKETKEDAI
jgi:hypothetical protein